jgi:hypothetical protein
MKKLVCILLVLSLTLSFCACGKQEKEAQTVETVPGIDPATGAWIGRGGCFTVYRAELPDGCRQMFWHDGEQYFLIGDLKGFQTDLYRGDQVVFHDEDYLDAVVLDEDGFWVWNSIRGESGTVDRFRLISYEGEEQKSFSVKLPDGTYGTSFTVHNGALYYNTNLALFLFDDNGTKRTEISHEEWVGTTVRDSTGEVWYKAEKREGGGTLYRINADLGTMEVQFTYDRGLLCTGDEKSSFFIIKGDGIDRVTLDGAVSALVIWDEIGYSVSGLTDGEMRPDIVVQPDGTYLLDSAMMSFVMKPAEPSELKARKHLTVGVLGSSSGFELKALNFNAQSEDCYIQIVDLTEDGRLTNEQAQLKLNTQILAGEGPDMLLFDKLSPYPFIHQELLRDLRTDIEGDADIAIEDIIPADAIINDCGGLFMLGDSLKIETRIGLQSRFGACWGWTFEKYQEVDRSMPEGSMTMYNLTKDYFLQNAVSRYIRGAIDWAAGTCDFDNEEFVKVLEACKNVRETPEDENNMVFGTTAMLLNGNYMATDLTMLTSAISLARISREIGSPISVIGFPTPDGSCGTDLRLWEPIGILNMSSNAEQCWQFVKYCLLNEKSGIPSYRPRLEAEIEDAKKKREPEEESFFPRETLDKPLTETEAQFLRELLKQIQHTTFSDENVLKIVKEEFAAVDAGDRSAREAVALIQSRVQLYVSEQSD